MKKLLILTTVIFFSTMLVQAQTADPELDYIKKAYSKEKKTIVEEYMGLDVQEGAKFWPIYAAYESKREKLALERLQLIQEYIDNGDKISPELADKIANGTLENSISLSKLDHDYYGKMKKAIGVIRAAKFMQLEVYLQTAWRGFVHENVPLIKELDKTQQN